MWGHLNFLIFLAWVKVKCPAILLDELFCSDLDRLIGNKKIRVNYLVRCRAPVEVVWVKVVLILFYVELGFAKAIELFNKSSFVCLATFDSGWIFHEPAADRAQQICRNTEIVLVELMLFHGLNLFV